MKRAVILVCGVACGGKTTRPELIAHAAPISQDAAVDVDADTEPDAWVDQCERETATIARGEVALETCQTGDSATSERARNDGFVTREMRARLVLTRAVGAPLTTELDTWTDGWEWSTRWKLEGVLAGPHGDEVLLISKSSDAAGPGIGAEDQVLRVFQLVQGVWTAVHDLERAKLEVTLSPDRAVATVTGCTTMQSQTPAGCGGYVDGDPAPVVQLRWDGTTVDETVVPVTSP